MSAQTQSDSLLKFDHTMRALRWGAIFVTAATFPFNMPQAFYLYGLLLLAAIYNGLFYLPGLRPLHRPFTILFADSLLVAALLTIVGGASTPYSAFLVFTVLTAAYLFRVRGAVVMVIVQLATLYTAAALSPFEATELNNLRIITISLVVLFAIAYFVIRITDDEHRENRSLALLRAKSDAERHRLQTLVNSLKDSVVVVDDKGVIRSRNEAAQTMIGGENLVGQKFREAIPLIVRARQQEGRVDLLADALKPQHRRDLSIPLGENKMIDLDLSLIPVIPEAKDKPSEFIIICEDITTERSLDEQRTGFIAIASHELRTPLTILEGALSTAIHSEAKMDPEIRSLLEQAHRNGKYLASIIRDITVLSEAQNDNLPIQLTQIKPAEILKSLAKDFSTQAAQKNIPIKVSIESKAPTVLSTERYIREILQNYITNAIKYSKHGTITLSAAASRGDRLLFSVSDEGRGISPKDQKMLFTKFFRAEDYRTEETGGTGLGLYLCLEIAERMNAKVWCESKLGKGSTFYLEVPPFSNLKRDQTEVVNAQVANLVEGL